MAVRASSGSATQKTQPTRRPPPLGDPGGLARRVALRGVVGDDPRDERLELRRPAELLGVDLAVGEHDPAQVARGAELADADVVVGHRVVSSH